MTCASKQGSIQNKIWKGYAKVAQKLGSTFQFYRPRGNFQLERGGDLLLEGGGSLLLEGGYPGTPLFTRNVSLNAEDMKYSKPNKYGKATWYAVMDGTGLRVGDYFIGIAEGGDLLLEDGTNLQLEDGSPFRLEGTPIGTYFIAAMQPLLPIFVVECNRVVKISRVQNQTDSGPQPYSGITPDNETAFVKGVPCSILQGTKGERDEANLPADTRSPWWTILMPQSVGYVRMGDLIDDDLGQRYIVSSNELTDLGYRITAMMAMA